jgi:hypothetical protein
MMRHESLVNLIGNLDPATFLDVARRCLQARGYHPALSDGRNDGGADFLVYMRGVEPAPCAVQVSIEKKWKPKLKQDAAKAARNGFSTLLFVSSRRLPNHDFFRIEDEVSQTAAIKLQKMDAQDIAGLAIDRDFVADILNVMGVAVAPTTRRSFERPRFRRDAAYACAFFGSDARELRKLALQETICTVLTNAGGAASRDIIVDQVALGMGLAANQRPQVISALDRLLQEGRIQGKNGEVSLGEKELGTRQSIQALAQVNMNDLRAKLDAYLAPFVKKQSRLEALRESLLEDIGALLMDTAARTSAAANSDSVSDGVRSRLIHLESTLESIGLASEERRKAIGDLAHIASESEYGKHLMAGEIALQLFRLRTSHLLRALESRDELRVVLDTSVAMPMLCNLLYSPANQQYFVASQHLYEQLLVHGISMVLPSYYLEEIASHPIDAHRDYREIIDMDPDLRGSTNAFVAHYVAMKQVEPHTIGLFGSYLEAFGLDEKLAHSDFYVARDAVMRRLQSLLGQYHIRVEGLRAGASARRQAEEAILEAQRDGGFSRPKVLLDHDAETLGWLFGRESDAQIAYVLCTWDRLHFQVRKSRSAEWDALDPVALGDILSLAAPEGHEVHLASAWVLALRFSDEDATRGAEVWDTLIRIEKGHLRDATLREQARTFKAAWLAEATQGPRTRDLQKAWEHWKSEHLPPR